MSVVTSGNVWVLVSGALTCSVLSKGNMRSNTDMIKAWSSWLECQGTKLYGCRFVNIEA